MPRLYAVKWHLYRVTAESSASAREAVIEMLKKDPKGIFHIETADLFDERRGLFRRLLGG